MSPIWVVVVAQAVVVVLLAAVMLGLLRRVLPTLARAEAILADSANGTPANAGLSPGSRVPHFAASGQDGTSLLSKDLLTDELSIVLFTSRDCEPCRVLNHELVHGGWPLDSPLILVSSQGEQHPGRQPTGNVSVLVQNDAQQVSAAFGSNIFPHAFLVSAGHIVRGTAIPESVADLKSLLSMRADQVAEPGTRPMPTATATNTPLVSAAPTRGATHEH